jgi:hypothetical protein
MPAWKIAIHKSWAARNPDETWVNNYIVNSPQADVTDAGTQNIVDQFVAMEAEFHLAPVQFLHATFSSLRAEDAYDPKMLRVFEIQGTGHRGIVVDDMALDLNIALKAKKVVAYGRAGTMFYRGCLTASDVVLTSAGKSELKPDSPVMNIGTWTNARGHVSNLAGVQWIMDVPQLHLANPQGNIEDRVVQNLLPSGISINKRNHKYFDDFSPAIRRAVRLAIATNGTVEFQTVDGKTGQPVLPPAAP